MRFVAPRKPKTLMEVNLWLTVGSLMSEEQTASGKKLPLREQGRLLLAAMPKATRVGQFIGLWTLMKYQRGAVTVDELANEWNEPRRTMYRRYEEFREVYGPVGHETPDVIADQLIADYRRRKETMNAGTLAKLLATTVSLPLKDPPRSLAL